MVQGFALARPELAPTSFHVFGNESQVFGKERQMPVTAPDAGAAPATVSPSPRPKRAFGRKVVP
jgi:hypothetical protein